MSPTKDFDLSTAAAESPAARPDPVALEVPVTVNGARTVEGSDKREPFRNRRTPSSFSATAR